MNHQKNKKLTRRLEKFNDTYEESEDSDNISIKEENTNALNNDDSDEE